MTSNRREFIKLSALAGGGAIFGFQVLVSCKTDSSSKMIEAALPDPDQWFDLSAYVKIGDTGLVTIMSPNPEIGQNVKTSMPMIIAEELDVAWKDVVVEQAGLDTDNFTRQVAGGSQSIRFGWKSLREAGAKIKHMLMQAAAKRWDADIASLQVSDGIITNSAGETLSYGELAAEAVDMEVPETVDLKDPKDYKIIGQGKTNVDMEGIITGQPLFGLDFARDGMVYAAMKRPDAFGMSLKDYDDSATRAVNGVIDVVKIGDKIAVIGKNTWAVIKGKKALQATYVKSASLESSDDLSKKMQEALDQLSDEPKRNDGDVVARMDEADQVFERSYEAPFLPHNTLEPMNFFADVTDDKVELIGPIQTPQWQRSNVAEALGREESEISIMMTRQGGGFGRRLYGNFVVEAAEISNAIRKPTKLIWTREDDMTFGPFRPSSAYKFKAALKDGKITGYHLTGAGVKMRNACREGFFPAGCLADLRIDSHSIDSNIPTGAWRAPVTNFLAYAEQAFFDELAAELGKDPVDLRLELLASAQKGLVGEVEYDTDKMIRMIEVAREKSDWDNRGDKHLGFSAYFCHNTYVAEVAEVELTEDGPRVKKVDCVVDCGLVINPKGAINQIEGGIIDGIGHAMYGDYAFEAGKGSMNNFNQYRLIRMMEVPEINIHFIESHDDPTGLGEPTLPPAGGAVANALHSATGKRLYRQPFVKELEVLG